MTQIVQAQFRQARSQADSSQIVAHDVSHTPRAPIRVRKYAGLKQRAAFVHEAQRVEDGCRDGYAAPATSAFGFLRDPHVAARNVDVGFHHCQNSGLPIDILPAQAQQFPSSKAGTQSDEVEWVIPRSPRLSKKHANLVLVQYRRRRLQAGTQVDVRTGAVVKVVPRYGVGEGLVQHRELPSDGVSVKGLPLLHDVGKDVVFSDALDQAAPEHRIQVDPHMAFIECQRGRGQVEGFCAKPLLPQFLRGGHWWLPHGSFIPCGG